jgi:hypothetical protein
LALSDRLEQCDMRKPSFGAFLRIGALALLATLVAACGRDAVRADQVQQASNIPASFDVTLIADKDNQFDFDGAPLTEEDLKSALRYRQEESLPVATVLLKRGEKQKVKSEHLVSLARVAFQLKINAYVQAKDGTISEVRAQVKD